ncbi:MAG: hypothetical protein COA58_14820 [Bacteroidetes bacterium]|nr:MAG: hypothetical protein COA58_14820 [Bacteroidota bacterium]
MNELPLIEDIKDDDLITMLFESEMQETRAINYLINRNLPTVRKFIFAYSGSTTEVNTVMNDATIILINNIKNGKFKNDSTVNTYFVGICKLIWKNYLKKKSSLKYNYSALESKELENIGEIPKAITRFENLNENNVRLNYIFSLITDKCKDVLVLWSQGFCMKEITTKLGYKNPQIAMNKKNTCIKRIIQLIQKNDDYKHKTL